MTPALRSLLTDLIDYAGLFPPAGLDMAAAVAEFVRHRREPERWMLGRFIAPADRLAELAAVAGPELAATDAWRISALVGARGETQAALAALDGQASGIHAFESLCAGRARVTSLEAPLAAQADFPARLIAALAAAGLGGRELFLEIPPAGDPGAALAAIAAVAAGRGEDGAGRVGARIGAKLRCGGVTADAFPSCSRVAEVIDHCRRLVLPLKFTAGLHHPVRHRARQPDVMMHGFMNVFGAGLLAHAAHAEPSVLTDCLRETDPAAFRFDADGLAWRDRRVPAVEVARVRRDLLCGFGSCSFDEPRADLAALGFLSTIAREDEAHDGSHC